jgi:hypothetical protein
MLKENKAEASQESETIVTKDQLSEFDSKFTNLFNQLRAAIYVPDLEDGI